MVPRKSRNECINNQKKKKANLSVETKVLQLHIITQRKKTENVVESIINDYYWGKLIEKLIKSNIKIESLTNRNRK